MLGVSLFNFSSDHVKAVQLSSNGSTRSSNDPSKMNICNQVNKRNKEMANNRDVDTDRKKVNYLMKQIRDGTNDELKAKEL